MKKKKKKLENYKRNFLKNQNLSQILYTKS